MILRPPRLQTVESEDEHRAATWLELFYDLVFVVAVANLAKRLLDDVSWVGVGEFVGLFIPLWWAWVGFTFYADRYDTDDLGQRLLAVAQMVSIALLAAAISGDVADSTAAFALAFVLARTVLLVMYLRARRHVPETRELNTGYIKGIALAAGVWLISAFVPEPWRYVLWAIGLLVDVATPYYYRKLQAKVPLSTSHLPERFGLFTILVLGESMAAVIVGLSHVGWETAPTIAAVLGVVIASSLWWLYFDNLDGSVVRRKPEQVKAWKPTVWIYSHLPLTASLTASGIGLEFLVGETGHSLPDAELWLVTGAIAAALVFMAMIHLSTVSPSPARRDPERARLRLVGAAAVLVLGLVFNGADTMVIAVALTVLMAILVGFDVAIGVRAAEAAAATARAEAAAAGLPPPDETPKRIEGEVHVENMPEERATGQPGPG